MEAADKYQVSLAEGPRLYRWVAAVFAFLVWPFVRVETQGLGLAGEQRTAVVVANHRSFFDALAALVAFRRIKRYPRVIVADNWFEKKRTGPLLRLAGAIPMNRKDPVVHLDAAKRVLDAGVPVLILPEGRLSGVAGDPQSIGEFKTGAARLASHADVPLWPIALVGTDDVWPRDRPFPYWLGTRRRRRVVLLGGEPFWNVDPDPRYATQLLEKSVVDLLGDAIEIHRRGNGSGPVP